MVLENILSLFLFNGDVSNRTKYILVFFGLTSALLIFISMFLFKGAVVALFPLTLLFLVVSMSNLSNDVRAKIPPQFY